MSTHKNLDLLLKIRKSVQNGVGFGALMRNIKITSATDGDYKAEFECEAGHLNSSGGLNAGFTASVVDTFTGIMLHDRPTGVGTNLHVHYLSDATEGDRIIVEARTVLMGDRLGFVECELKHHSNGAIIARGRGTVMYADRSRTDEIAN